MNQEFEKEDLNFDGVDEVPQDVLKAMNEAATYKGKKMKSESARKRKAKVARKKGDKPPVNEDRQERKSKAQELQQKLNRGDGFMKNQNVGKKNNTNNVVGEELGFDVSNILGDRESTVKQRTNLECTMEIGIGAAQRDMLVTDYEALRANVRTFDLDTIPSEEEFTRYCNTYGAVAIARIVNNNWKVLYTKEDGEVGRYSYKDVKDQFRQPWIFSHAVNQFGRYSNNDLGITVEPVWVDFEQIGILEPSKLASVAQKVAKLYELNGLKVLSGVQCESGANPEIMLSHEEKTSVDGMDIIQYRQYFRHINMAEFLHCSRIKRNKFAVKMAQSVVPAHETPEQRISRINAEEEKKSANEALLADRYLAAFINVYDLSYFTAKNRAVMLSAIKSE